MRATANGQHPPVMEPRASSAIIGGSSPAAARTSLAAASAARPPASLPPADPQDRARRCLALRVAALRPPSEPADPAWLPGLRWLLGDRRAARSEIGDQARPGPLPLASPPGPSPLASKLGELQEARPTIAVNRLLC
jgi:hypothetical protein